MKNKIVNKYKSAGIWNIACGVLATVAYFGVFVLVSIGLIVGGTEQEQAVGVLIAILLDFVGLYLWEIFMTYPFFMILAGIEMLSKHKKGVGVKLFIVFNALMKLFTGISSGLVGFVFLFGASLFIVACGVFLILVTVLLIVSIVMDFRALFSRSSG